MENHTSILDRFRKEHFELFALKPDVQVFEKFECNGKDGWISNGDSMNYFLGVLDDIRFYGCALSDSEITALLNTFPTSIDDNFEKHSLAVYPNPVHGKVKIEYSVPVRSDVGVEIFNTLGRNVYKRKKQNEIGSNSIFIDTKDFNSAGVYYVKISIGNDIQTKRLMVLD